MKNKKKDFAPREYKGPTQSDRKGLLIIYTGEGKGKSTAAFGTVLRSLGRGYKVAIVQFIKGRWISGEILALKKFRDQVHFFSAGEDFTWKTKDLKKDMANAARGWEHCIKLLKRNRHQVYVFDELLYAIQYRYISLDKVLSGLRFKDPGSHVILTGRKAPSALIKKADLVTFMQENKHPFRRGIVAQAGVDF